MVHPKRLHRPPPTAHAWAVGLVTGACFSLAVPGCGGSSSGGAHGIGSSSGPDGAARQAELDDLCDSVCERDTRCPDDEDPDSDAAACRSECLSESPDPELVRGDVLRGLAQCGRQLTCDQSDDQCLEQVVQKLVPDYASSPLLKLCLDVQNQCGGFSDDACSYAVTFTDAGKKRLEDCLNTTCDRVGACVKGLTQQI